ncbi:MAG: 30S ribosome-binding factor RbfA [Alphaproteobacteria bacterium]
MRRAKDSENSAGRHLRVGEAIRHALVQIFARGRLREPELHDISITISEARATPDLRHVTIFVMPLGGRDRDGVVAALNRKAPLLRGEVTRVVGLRFAPQLHFEADPTFDVADRVSALLNDPRVARDLGKAGPPKPKRRGPARG